MEVKKSSSIVTGVDDAITMTGETVRKKKQRQGGLSSSQGMYTNVEVLSVGKTATVERPPQFSTPTGTAPTATFTPGTCYFIMSQRVTFDLVRNHFAL